MQKVPNEIHANFRIAAELLKLRKVKVIPNE